MPLRSKLISDPDWERIKNWVGAPKTDGDKHPLEEEMERMEGKKSQHLAEGGVADGSNPFDQQATDIMGGVTPEAIARLSQSLARPTTGQSVASGFAGLGDAIASVGGQNPGHLKASQDLIQKNRETALSVPAEMAAFGKERFGISQGLQEQSPDSKVADYARQTYGPLAQKLGLDVRGASAKMIGDLVGKTIDQLKNESEAALSKEIHGQTAAYQQHELENQRLGLEQTGANQGAERAEAEKRRRIDSAEKTMKGYSWNPFNPISRDEYKRAAGTIANGGEQETGQQPAATAHPQASEAMQWAEQHPTDPRSAEILKRLRK